MRKGISYISVAVAAAVSLGVLGIAGASTSGPGIQALQAARMSAWTMPSQAAVPGTQLWLKRYNGPGNKFDDAYSVAVSPNGATVFVTGESIGTSSSEDYATAAYNAATGARLWVKRYNGPGNGTDTASSIAVSPAGDRVFVTGASLGTTSSLDYATVAYDAATGTQLWVKRYNGPGNSLDGGGSITVSPSGDTVFVTGASTGAATSGFDGYDYATIAYSAVTGARLWVERYNGPADKFDGAHSVAATEDMVFVTGQSTGTTSREDYATIAYDAATGTQLWVQRYNGPGNGLDGANSIKVSPSAGTVFVTGESTGLSTLSDYATIAYDAATGAQLWVKRYNGPANSYDSASALAVSPAGGAVFVTGDSRGAASQDDYATVAYNAATGARLWVKRYDGPANSYDSASALAVSPAGNRVYVTGFSYGATSNEDYATVAYGAATGAQLWINRYDGPANGTDRANSVAVSPSAGTVFVTGYSASITLGYDYATIAYSGG